MRLRHLAVLLASSLAAACVGAPSDDEPSERVEDELAGACFTAPPVTPPTRCGPFAFRLPWKAGIRRRVTQGTSTTGTHAAGTKDAYAFDFRVRRCDGDSAKPPSGDELEVRAVAAGTVVDARFDKNEIPGIANLDFVLVEHTLGSGAKVQSLYAHLKKETVAPVKVGDRVARGARLGRIGASGTDAIHLHFQFQNVPTNRTRDCGSDYPFCRSVSYLTLDACGFTDGKILRSGYDYASTNDP